MVNRTDIFKRLRQFKRKFYLNQVVKGVLLFSGAFSILFLVANLLEYIFDFSSLFRTILFFGSVLGVLYIFHKYLYYPLLQFSFKQKRMSDDEAAKKIGQAFPTVKDRLLNYLQLIRQPEKNPLLEAGILQKEATIEGIDFETSIELKENKKYLKYAFSPISLIVIIFAFFPHVITDSTQRILYFNEEFVADAPFSFESNIPEYAFRNENATINLSLIGNSIPEQAYIIQGDRKIKMEETGVGSFEYMFKNLQSDKQFRFESAGYISDLQKLKVVERPGIGEFHVELYYPKYINRKSERFTNIGNIEIPEGTLVKWRFATIETEQLSILFEQDSIKNNLSSKDNNLFEFESKIYSNTNYSIELENKYSKNKEKIQYTIQVKKDEFPEINLNSYQDTLFYQSIILGGDISDDHGLTSLTFNYRVKTEQNTSSKYQVLKLPLQSQNTRQAFYYPFELDSIDLFSGSSIEYFMEVKDNDGIHGRKTSRTSIYQFKIPSAEEIQAQITEGSNKTEEQGEEALKKAKDLEERLKKAEEALKSDRKLEWEEEENLREIVKEREELEQAIENLKEFNRQNDQQKSRFSPQDEQYKERSKRLQEMMNDLMDEETKKLYEELQRMLDEKSGVEQLQQLMEQINRRNKNVQQEIDRAMELYKKLKLDYEIAENIKNLENLAEKQENLADETKEGKRKEGDLLKDQNNINKSFDEAQKQLDKLQEMNQELQQPGNLPDQSQLKKEIEEKLEESKNSLENLSKQDQSDTENSKSSDSQQKSSEENEKSNDEEKSAGEKNKSGDQSPPENQKSPQNQSQRNKANESQQKAAEGMKKMAQNMQDMQAGMEMQMMQENLDYLRDIIHNLLKLSFDQESLFKNFKEVNESDPQFVPLSQNQLKLRDDARVIEDSLISLSKRVFQLSNFITREVTEMNEYMESSASFLKERNRYEAISKQQFAMTSMNNLALLLDDVLEQMMNAMSQSGNGKSNQKKGDQKSLAQQQQEINQKIQQLKEGGASGRELSEELAKLAAEQARIRQALQEMQQRMEEMDPTNGGIPGGDIPGKMEQTETELVNKQLTEQMIRRQQDILTRLLEAENSLREKEMDEERKGETAKEYERIVPASFEEYFKLKEKEIELLKTLPPKYYPYYKKEVTDYFKRLGEGGNKN